MNQFRTQWLSEAYILTQSDLAVQSKWPDLEDCVAAVMEPQGGMKMVDVTLFDAAALLVRTDNDAEFARELITVFVASASETLARIEALLQHGPDPQLQQQLAHSLKGSAGTVAALAVAARAAALEHAIGAAEVRAAHHDLRAAFEDTLLEWRHGGWTESDATAFTGARPAG